MINKKKTCKLLIERLICTIFESERETIRETIKGVLVQTMSGIRMRGGKEKKPAVYIFIAALCFLCTACGTDKEISDALTGNLSDIMDTLYENAELSEDFRAGMDSFETYEITDDLEMSILGTDEITYLEGVASIPMISPNAYQCVLLRVDEDDVETAKQQLKENADLNKWICVSAETMLIESRGNVIFFVMGDQDTVYALNSAFQNL